MTIVKIVGLLLGGGLLAKLVLGNKSGVPTDATPADPAPPVVPVDASGQRIPQDAAGTPVTSSGKAKIPMPVKPDGWQLQPRFVQKDGITYYSSSVASVLAEVLKARTAAKIGPAPDGGSKYQLHPLGVISGPGALVLVKIAQSEGRVVLAAKTLLEGEAGQTYALLFDVPKSYLGHITATDAANLAVLPKL